jgi:prepilin-type N-terminal cleavage/methylation domain-containing protein
VTKFKLRQQKIPRHKSSQQLGFALLELIVAMAIMAIVGLLAWRGMDAMIRGREVIERRSNEDLSYSQLVRQFDRDCQEILRRDELNAATSGSISSAATPNTAPNTSSNVTAQNPSATSAAAVNLSTSTLPAIAVGSKNIWWLRHYRADMQDAWLLVGYGMGPSGLERWTSQPVLRRDVAIQIWNSTLRNPDLVSTDLLVSWQVPNIVRQAFVVQSSLMSGAGGSGISAAGTGSSPVNVSPTNTIPSNPGVSLITPGQQGLIMRWWLKDIALPITRSCLMGSAL